MSGRAAVGLDLSLQATGVCVSVEGQHPVVRVVKSKTTGPQIAARANRLFEIRDTILAFVDEHLPDDVDTPLFLIETPAYGNRGMQGSQHDRSGLWWLVAAAVLERGKVGEVPPSVLKKFATSKGDADKPDMKWFAAREFPGLDYVDDNGADALWLATIGRYHLDPDLSGVHDHAYRRSAAAAVVW